METYRGLPVPEQTIIYDHETSGREIYAGQSNFLIASLHLCGNTGTYVDAPLHRDAGGTDLAQLELFKLAHLPIHVVRAPVEEGRAIGPEHLNKLDLEGKAILFHTGWSRHWRQELYFTQNPYLTEETCALLVKKRARFVGIDSLNVDDVSNLARPAHTLLLRAGIPICEHMTHLDLLAQEGFLHAVPIAWKGGATFPVRAYVMQP